jgi:hypothetical protein
VRLPSSSQWTTLIDVCDQSILLSKGVSDAVLAAMESENEICISRVLGGRHHGPANASRILVPNDSETKVTRII